MELTKETQRSLYAALGAGAWVIDTLRAAPESLGQAWQRRDQWWQRAEETYDDLARRGRTVMGQAQRDTRQRARQVGRTVRRVPGVAPVEGELAGMAATEADLPIAHYDSLTVADIVKQLPQLTGRQLHEIEGYETRHRSRSTVLNRIDELRGTKP